MADLLQVFLGDDPGEGVAELKRQIRVGSGELDDQGVVVHGGDGVDRPHGLAAPGCSLRIEDAIERELDVVGGDRAAVGELGVLDEVERPLRAVLVGLPGVCELRLGLELVADAGQVAEDHGGQHVAVAGGCARRVEARLDAGCCELEHAAHLLGHGRTGAQRERQRGGGQHRKLPGHGLSPCSLVPGLLSGWRLPCHRPGFPCGVVEACAKPRETCCRLSLHIMSFVENRARRSAQGQFAPWRKDDTGIPASHLRVHPHPPE